MGFLHDTLSSVKISGKSPFQRIEDEIYSFIPFYIPSGSPIIDWAIGAYKPGNYLGIPHTRLIEIFGPVSSGKSTLFESIIRQAQLGFSAYALIADAEHAHSAHRMIEQGLDPDLIEMIENDENDEGIKEDITLEEFFEYSKSAVTAIRKQDRETPIICGLDSLAMIDTDEQKRKRKEREKETMKDDTDKSRVMSRKLGDWLSFMSGNNVTSIIVNQIREKPGITFGDPRYTPGGNALPFLASLRIGLNKGEIIKASEDIYESVFPDDPVGLRVPFKIEKNRMAAPFRKGHFSLMFDSRGIWSTRDWLDLYFERGFDKKEGAKFEKSGSWYSWGDERMGQGKANTLVFLMDNPDALQEMIHEIVGEKQKEEEEEE